MGVAYEGIWLRLWTFNSCGFVFLNICMISVVTCWSLELDMDIQCIILWTLCVILINGCTLIQCFSLLENCFYFTTYLKQMKCTRDSIHQLYHLTNPGSYILCPIWWPFSFWSDWAMYQIINLGLTLIGYFTLWCSHFSALLCVAILMLHELYGPFMHAAIAKIDMRSSWCKGCWLLMCNSVPTSLTMIFTQRPFCIVCWVFV